jgi:hypothetical protein
MTTPDLQPSAVNKKSWFKVLRVWFLLLGSAVFSLLIFGWVALNLYPREKTPAVSISGNNEDFLAHSIVNIFVGAFFLVLGIGGYVVAVLTQCLTTNFTAPVWPSLKVKIWFANLLVLLGVGLGVGFIAAAFLTPVLAEAGVSQELSTIIPVGCAVLGVQFFCAWFLIWAPLEKRAIEGRLLAMGLTPAQLQTGTYVGLSNPEERGVGKRFCAIEEDIGMMWVGPESLIYYGDGERMNITREVLVSVERQVDGRSTTALSGTAHVILGVLLPNGTVRRIRLHTEGVRTMGGKRKAMDQLSAAIEGWRAGAVRVG